MAYGTHTSNQTTLTTALAVVADAAPTMTTREIADLTGKRHDNVMRDTRAMLVELHNEGDLLKFEGVYQGGNGETRPCFNLPKRETLILVSGYSVAMRAKIIDRWQELEQGGMRVSRAPRLDVSREHRLMMKDQMMYAKLAGLTGNQMLLAANRATSLLTGIDNLGLLGIANMPAPQNEALLSPSDIAERIGMKSSQAVNKRLCELAMQTQHRDHKARIYYEPTEAGIAAGATMVDTGKRHGNGTPVRQLRWSSAICSLLEETAGQAH